MLKEEHPGPTCRGHMGRGFTLLELLAVVTILAAITLLGVHAFSGQLQRSRLSAAAQQVVSALQQARSEALKQGQAVYVNFVSSADRRWCYGISDLPDCDCNRGNCAITVRGIRRDSSVDGDTFPGIVLQQVQFGTHSYTRFSPQRGTAAFGSITLADRGGERLKINLGLTGRIRVCTPDAPALHRYPLC